ncbi:hypothetical protein MEP301_gp54 [Methylophilales phage MEP301]|nr:hypothetical protein MEP301_gp54 [Methylophilales phage MEP301]
MFVHGLDAALLLVFKDMFLNLVKIAEWQPDRVGNITTDNNNLTRSKKG